MSAESRVKRVTRAFISNKEVGQPFLLQDIIHEVCANRGKQSVDYPHLGDEEIANLVTQTIQEDLLNRPLYNAEVLRQTDLGYVLLVDQRLLDGLEGRLS